VKRRALLLALPVLLLPAMAAAQDRSAFHPGPVFKDFAPIADVASDIPIPAGTRFKIDFDVSEKAKPGELSRAIETAGRFINMHVSAGVPLDAIKIAIVVHGGASQDLLAPAAYAARNEGKANGSAPAIAQLLAKGVEIQLCGQSAVAYGIKNADLLPGVKMSVSAMTSHALLQQAGYTLNPF
jgi:intracellular sulfur oxidation DsrE/DsrF family protein